MDSAAEPTIQSLDWVQQERLPFVWKTQEIPRRIQMKWFIPVEFSGKNVISFEVLPFSRSYRSNMYHMFGLPVPGFMSRESEKFTGIL